MNTHMIIHIRESIYILTLSEIYYFESDLRMINIVTKETNIKYYDTFQDLRTKLNSDFVQTHRSYIVNMKKIRKISGEYISFRGITDTVPISKTKKNMFMETLSNSF